MSLHCFSFSRAVSISLVFINKALLSGSTNGTTVDAPLFVTWFQCVVTVGLCVALAFGAKFFPNLGKFPQLGLDVQVMLKVFIATRQHVFCDNILISFFICRFFHCLWCLLP